MKRIVSLIATILLMLLSLSVLANPGIESTVNDYLADQKRIENLCIKKFSDLPISSCRALVIAGVESIAGKEVNKEALESIIKSDLKSPEFLNSILVKQYGESVPLGLEFKNLESKNGEAVLGLAYEIDKTYVSLSEVSGEKWNSNSSIVFNANGTITNESKENPRNFLDTKISAVFNWSTQIPVMTDEFGEKLTLAAVDAAPACAGAGGGQSEACRAAKEKALALLDDTSEFLNAFQFYEVGIDGGYESDQRFIAGQSKFGFFIFGQYEAWGKNSFLGQLGLTPAIRLGVDKVEPNEETLRAKSGDDSSFYRYDSEVSLWMPIGSYFGQKDLVLAFNYRHLGEIDPSDSVVEAGLDRHTIRTYSIAHPTGLFISYSSGALPLDINSTSVVELGWKTYF